MFTLAHCMQARARTEQEAAIVAKELPAADIRSLLAGPALVDFGRVAAAAEVTAYFCINNTLSRPVHALVDANSFEHLQRSQHMSQARMSLLHANRCQLVQKCLLPAIYNGECRVHGQHAGSDMRAVTVIMWDPLLECRGIRVCLPLCQRGRLSHDVCWTLCRSYLLAAQLHSRSPSTAPTPGHSATRWSTS